MAASADPITPDELRTLFGDTMPMDAVRILFPEQFGLPKNARPTSAVRADLVAFAERHHRARAREGAPVVVPPDILDASRRASAGDAFTSGQPWFSSEDMMIVGSPDRHAGFVIADFNFIGADDRDWWPSQDGCGLSEAKDDARLAALAWTFVRRLIADQERRERLL